MNKTGKAPDLIEPTSSSERWQTAGCRPRLLSVPLLAVWTSMHSVTLEATYENGISLPGPLIDRQSTSPMNKKKNSIELSCTYFRSVDTERGFQMVDDIMIHWVGQMQGRGAAASNRFWGRKMNRCETLELVDNRWTWLELR